MPDHASDQVIGNRFRLGVVLGSVLVCLLIVGLLHTLRLGPFALDESLDAEQSAVNLPKRTPAEHVTSVPKAEPKAESRGAGSAHQVSSTVPPSMPVGESPAMVSRSVAPTAPPRTEAAVSGRVAQTAANHGRIVGRVVLTEAPPPEVNLQLDPTCGRTWTNGPTATKFYVFNSEGGLADVFVHLSGGLPNGRFPPDTEPVLIDQRSCWFFPQVVGAQTGQTLLVRNSDPLLHNVHWTPVVAGNPESNRAQLPKGQDLAYTFFQPELFLRLKCDVHPWMFAHVGLLDHPWFAVTDAKGDFVLPELPPGEYEVHAVHRRTHPTGTGLRLRAIVEAGRETTVRFEIVPRGL